MIWDKKDRELIRRYGFLGNRIVLQAAASGVPVTEILDGCPDLHSAGSGPGEETVTDDKPERPDLTRRRWRFGLRRSNAARPIPSKRKYRRKAKHRKQDGQ